MLKIKSYVKVNSLAEAYELNQKKTARILGGMVWMKMGNRAVSTAIGSASLELLHPQQAMNLWKRQYRQPENWAHRYVLEM